MEKTRVIQFEMTYEEYLALVIAANSEIASTSSYLEIKEEQDELYRSSKSRVEALERVLKKMDERVGAVIKEDVHKEYEFMKG